MQGRFVYATIILFAAIILGACNSAETSVSGSAQNANKQATPPQAAPSDGARRITIHELQDLMKKGQAVVIDVRNQAAYDQGHIPGSKLIPSGEILNHINEMPRDKTIVTYCS